MFSGSLPRSPPEIREPRPQAEVPSPNSLNSCRFSGQNTTTSQNQGTAFIAAVSSLFGSSAADVERKKRQQEQVAYALQRQIEEKRRQNPRTHDSMATVADQASHLLTEIQGHVKPSQTQPLTVTFSDTQTSSRPKKVYAESMPSPLPPGLTINTASPFEHSKVVTPPLGFSMRKSGPLRTDASDEPRLRPGYRFLSRENFKNEIIPPSGAVCLECESEFIYPDGHISRVSSRK